MAEKAVNCAESSLAKMGEGKEGGGVSVVHLHKCCVHECEVLVECDGDCVEGEVPARPVCPKHEPMWNALDKALDEAGYTEDGKFWYLNGVKQGVIPRLF